MGILNSFVKWKDTRHEQRISDMQAKGICPDCRGVGVNTIGLNDYFYYSQYSCPGCDGSGQYTDWANTNQIED